MKRTILILLALLTLAPATLRAQEGESLYKGWGIGFQAGVGGMLPTGSLGDDLKGCALFTAGLNAECRRWRLKADVAYGQPSFKNENPYNVIDSQGRNLQLNATANPTLVGGGVQLGYTLWRQGSLKITPAVGVAFSRLSWDINHIKYEKDEEDIERPVIDNVTGVRKNNFSWVASVDFDIKLHARVVDYPFGIDRPGRYVSSVRISPFVTHAKFSDFNPSVKGCCLGLTVSYAGILHTF